MTEQDIIVRLDRAIDRGNEALKTRGTMQTAQSRGVNATSFMEWHSQSLTALTAIFGPNHPLTTSFINVTQYEGVPRPYSSFVEQGLGVLLGAKSDVENGWTWTLQERIHQEVFDDFLEMASHLVNAERYKDPAAVLAGGVLEEHVRQLSQKHDLAVQSNLAAMNDALWKKEVLSKPVWRQVQAWYDLRTLAAHGHFSEYTEQQVKDMISGIRNFMSQYPA